MAPLGIIAGLGDLPVAIAENAIEEGQGAYVLRLKGFELTRALLLELGLHAD